MGFVGDKLMDGLTVFSITQGTTDKTQTGEIFFFLSEK